MENYKKLYRSNNKVIAGVCGGLAEYFDIDPIIVRILFLLIAFAGGGGVIVYLILWIAISPQAITFNNTDSDIPYATEVTDENKKKIEKNEYAKKNNLIAGVLLIGIGLVLFTTSVIPSINFRHIWPLILVIVGGVIIVSSLSNKNQ